MNDTLKTLFFVVAAAAAAVAALASRPSAISSTAKQEVRDQLLCPDLKNPLDVAGIEIAKYDESRGDVSVFQAVRTQDAAGRHWVIPSHSNYPADSTKQVASAAASMLGLKIVEMVGDEPGAQQEYGVVDPDPKKLQLGAAGVGQRVVFKDDGGKNLLAVVIGKEVPGQPNLRYVRKVGELPIYIVAVKTDSLSTNFDDWIESNLLSINTLDMKQLRIHDYSIHETEEGPALEMRRRTILDYDEAADAKWKLAADLKYAQTPDAVGDSWKPVKMPSDEELNAARLDELRTALGDLKIVGVNRKPAGLSADLKLSAGFSFDRETRLSLRAKGFYVGKLSKDGPVELCSGDGEFRVLMKDGVEYVLRFGDVAGASASKPKDGKADAKSEEKKGDGLDRYILVMAEFNPEIVAKPELLPLPTPPKEEPAKTEEKSAEKKDAKKDAKKDDAKKEEAKKDEPKKDEVKKDEPKKEPSAKEKYEAERARVEKENRRLQEAYDQQLADGKKHVAELNARFADWYYVIPGDVYKKIHLSHADIFKKKDEKDKKSAAPNAGLMDTIKRAVGGKGGEDEHAGHDHGK